MKIGNTEINLFRRAGLIFEFILIKDPAPNHGLVVWLGGVGVELTIRKQAKVTVAYPTTWRN